MPRIRTIKPEFFSNEEIGNLPAEARLLFIGLWTLADREGRLQDRPIRIGAQLFPYDAWAIASLLEELDHAGLIARYEAEGKKCIQIINFTKHQNPHPKETRYGLPPPLKRFTGITGNSTEVTEIQHPCPVDSHVLGMEHGTTEHGTLSPTPLSAPAEKKTSERESKSRFSLKECEQYAASLKSIKTPKAYAKTIWRSGEDDDAVAGFLVGHSGNPPKKPPPIEASLDELKQLAKDLERMELTDAAKALRAAVKLE